LYKSDANRFIQLNLSNNDLAIERKRILEYYKKKLMGVRQFGCV